MPENGITELELAARRIRATCVQMARGGREGHLSSALSCADILVALGIRIGPVSGSMTPIYLLIPLYSVD